MKRFLHIACFACLLFSLLWTVKGAYYLKPTGKCSKHLWDNRTQTPEKCDRSSVNNTGGQSKGGWTPGWMRNIRISRNRKEVYCSILFCTRGESRITDRNKKLSGWTSSYNAPNFVCLFPAIYFEGANNNLLENFYLCFLKN